MRLFLIYSSIVFISHYSNAQNGVGVGTNDIESDVIFKVHSEETNSGVLIPKMTSEQRKSGWVKTDGVMVFDTTNDALFYFNNNSWHQLGSPIGSIIMWSGSSVPEGWALCDGSWYNPDDHTDIGTESETRTREIPNLSGRFIVGLDENKSDYNTIGKTGGLEINELDVNDIPKHKHNISGTITGGSHSHLVHDPGHVHKVRGYKADGGDNDIKRGSGKNGADFDSKSSPTGITIPSSGSHSHSVNLTMSDVGTDNPELENRPPYYVLAYIIKL